MQRRARAEPGYGESSFPARDAPVPLYRDDEGAGSFAGSGSNAFAAAGGETYPHINPGPWGGHYALPGYDELLPIAGMPLVWRAQPPVSRNS